MNESFTTELLALKFTPSPLSTLLISVPKAELKTKFALGQLLSGLVYVTDTINSLSVELHAARSPDVVRNAKKENNFEDISFI